MHFTMHHDFKMMELADAVEIIIENTHEDADIIWGTTYD